MPEPPHRRLRLVVDLEADTLDDLASALTQMATDLLVDGSTEGRRLSGGWSTGYMLTLTDQGEERTGDQYRAELQEWVAAKRSALPDTPEPAADGDVVPATAPQEDT